MHFSRKSPALSSVVGLCMKTVLFGLLWAPLLPVQAQTNGSFDPVPRQGAVTVVPEKPRTTGTSTSDTSQAFSAQASDPSALKALFMSLTPGTYWLFRGTVDWTDPQTDKTAQSDVTLKMTVQRVIQKPDFTIAILSGFPRDLDWASAEVEPMPWLLIETNRHEIYLDSLPPDFDYAKLEKDAASLDKFLSEDNLLFRWPLKRGLKFGDAESLRRDDDKYCWVVTEQQKKNLSDIKGLSSHSADVFLLRYASNPDDTQYELSPGVGILSYEYHHHGTVADTSLTLHEFHPAQSTAASGANP